MRGRALILFIAVIAFANAAPLLGRGTLPLVDVYQHEAQVALWMAPGPGMSVSLWGPYMLTYMLWRGIATVAGGADAAATPVVMLLAWMQPLALALLLAARRRSLHATWAGLVTALGYPLAFGFLPYHLGMTLFLVGLAAVAWWLSSGTVAAAVCAALVLVAATATHALSGLLAILAALVLCLERVRARAPWTVLAPLVPAGALVAIWQAIYWRDPGADVGFLWISSPVVRLVRYPVYVGGGFTVAADRWILVAIAVGLAFSIQALVRRQDRGDPALAIVGLGLLAAYFVAPDAWGHVHSLFGRFAPLSFLCLVAALPAPAQPAIGWLGFAAPLLAIAGARVRLAQDLSAIDRSLGDVTALLDRVPRDATLAWAGGSAASVPPLELPILVNIPARAAARSGARAPLFYGAQMIVDVDLPRPEATWDAATGTLTSPAPPDFVLLSLRDPPETIPGYRLEAVTPALQLYERQ